MPVSALSPSATSSPAVFAVSQLQRDIQETTYRIASGNRMYDAGDDAASLATSITLQSQVTSLRQALLNSAQANSLLQVAYGALGSISDLLDEMKSLATQSSAGGLTNNNRAFLDTQFQNRAREIDRIASETRFNGITLLDGSGSGTLDFVIGESSASILQVIINGADTTRLFNNTTPTVATQIDALAAQDTVDDGIEILQNILTDVGSNRSALGSNDEVVTRTIGQVDSARGALLAADVPKESARKATLLVQQQVAVSVNAQTSTLSNNLLDLLRIQLKQLT